MLDSNKEFLYSYNPKTDNRLNVLLDLFARGYLSPTDVENIGNKIINNNSEDNSWQINTMCYNNNI